MSESTKTVLPTDPAERKAIPLVTGVLDYFPNALAEVAKVSKAGNDQHNPGQPLHWARGKSMDHADTLARHLVDRGTFDKDNVRHSAKVAWRALAMLEQELEDAGAPMGRGSRAATPDAGWICDKGCGSTHSYGGYAEKHGISPAGLDCGTLSCPGYLVRA